MASIHKPTGRRHYFIKLHHPRTGEQLKRSTGTGDIRKARRFAADFERELMREDTPRPNAPTGGAPSGPTVDDLMPAWLADRARRKVKSLRNDKSRVRNHILPALGSRVAAEIEPRDVLSFVNDLTANGLAPRTVRNVVTLLKRFFRHLVVQRVIAISPCQFDRGDLPTIEDRDPEWRVGARLARAEAETILASSLIPADRQMFYGLLFYAGLRQGEVCALRWRHVDTTREPLWALIVANTGTASGTKTGVTREIPIHPQLRAALTAWREHGWSAMNKRAPKDDDLIVPSRERAEQVRRPQPVWQRWKEDLERLGLRHRDMHATRRTFIDLGLEAGVLEEVLSHLTHRPKRTMMNAYGRRPWRQLCEAVLAIELSASASPSEEGECAALRAGLVPRMVPKWSPNWSPKRG